MYKCTVSVMSSPWSPPLEVTIHQTSLWQQAKSSSILSHHHVSSHIIISHLCWPMFEFLRSWFKAAVKLVRGSVTDETTKGRGSFHTLMFTFPVSLFPQKLGVPWLFGSEGLQLEGGLHSHLNTSHLGGDEGERRHWTAAATCLCFSHQHIPILQHSQITIKYTLKELQIFPYMVYLAARLRWKFCPIIHWAEGFHIYVKCWKVAWSMVVLRGQTHCNLGKKHTMEVK